MKNTLLNLFWALLILVFVSPVILGSVGAVAMLAPALLATPLLFSRNSRSILAGEWGVLIFPAVFVVLAILFLINVEQVSDLRFILNFIALPLSVPAFLLARRHAGGNFPLVIVTIALVGTVMGALVGAYQVLMVDAARAAGFFNNPNMYAHLVLVFGFMALPGLALSKSRWRFVYLAGPFLGIAATILSGSRGTMLAIPFFFLFAIVFLLKQPGGVRWVLNGVIAVVVVAGLGLAAMSSQEFKVPRVSDTVSVMAEVFNNGTSKQWGTQIRIDLYKGAWRAFTESPLVGHGWANANIVSAEQLEGRRPATGRLNSKIAAHWPHLHNDFLQFAVAGGVIGIASFLALLMSPLVRLKVSGPYFSHRLYIASLFVTGQIIFGLFNGVFAFDIGINTFVFATAILAGSFRPPVPE